MTTKAKNDTGIPAWGDLDITLSVDEERLLTVREYATLTRTPMGTVYADIHHKKLPVVHVGPRRPRIRMSTYQALVESRNR